MKVKYNPVAGIIQKCKQSREKFGKQPPTHIVMTNLNGDKKKPYVLVIFNDELLMAAPFVVNNKKTTDEAVKLDTPKGVTWLKYEDFKHVSAEDAIASYMQAGLINSRYNDDLLFMIARGINAEGINTLGKNHSELKLDSDEKLFKNNMSNFVNNTMDDKFDIVTPLVDLLVKDGKYFISIFKSVDEIFICECNDSPADYRFDWPIHLNKTTVVYTGDFIPVDIETFSLYGAVGSLDSCSAAWVLSQAMKQGLITPVDHHGDIHFLSKEFKDRKYGEIFKNIDNLDIHQASMLDCDILENSLMQICSDNYRTQLQQAEELVEQQEAECEQIKKNLELAIEELDKSKANVQKFKIAIEKNDERLKEEKIAIEDNLSEWERYIANRESEIEERRSKKAAEDKVKSMMASLSDEEKMLLKKLLSSKGRKKKEG